MPISKIGVSPMEAMMTDTQSPGRNTFFTRPFNDPANYPYGFSRSGDFSISESNALSQYGLLITALIDGNYIAVTQEDQELRDVVLGKKPVDLNNVVQRAWDKYQQRIHRKKHVNIYGSNTVVQDDESNDEPIIEEDLDDDV
jgi:uncharacterized protein YifE (UPF0438 family)